MDISTIIETFVLSETQKPGTSGIPTTNTRMSSMAAGTGARATVDDKKKRITMINATKKEKHVKNDEDDDYDTDDGVEDKEKTGDKKKSTIQRQSQATQRRQSNRQSTRPYSNTAVRKSAVAAVAAAAATAVDLSVLKMKHLKAVRRHTRVDMLGIGNAYEPDTNDACYEIEEMYATQKDMRRQSSRQSVNLKRRDD